MTPEQRADDQLSEALLLLGETVQDIRRLGDAIDRGVASRASCRAFADRVSAARAVIARSSTPGRICGTCAHYHGFAGANYGTCGNRHARVNQDTETGGEAFVEADDGCLKGWTAKEPKR